jgi:hypothetical protein
MLQHVPADLRATFCAATHTTPADVRRERIASAVADERLTVEVLKHKLNDAADFAVQLALSLPADALDLSDVIDCIDEARAALRNAVTDYTGIDTGRTRTATAPDVMQALRDMVRTFRHARRSEFASDDAHRAAIDCELRARAALFKATGETL